MISTARRLPARSALVGLALAVVAGVLPGSGAAAQDPADPPPAPAPASDPPPDPGSDTPERVVLRVDAPMVSEKGGSVTLVGVTASFPDGSGVLSEDVAVSVTVGSADDTAVGSEDGSEADYMNIEGFEMTIPAGESSVSMGGFVLTVTDDDLAEGFETLTVAGSTAAAGIESVGGAVITIVDDDAVVVLSADSDPGEGVSTRVAEGEVSQVAVSAELPAGASAERDLTVSLSTGAEGDLASGSADGTGADYAAAEGWEVTIPAGEAAAVGSFQLAVTEDNLAEGDETLTVGGEVITAGGAGAAVIGTSLTIADGDDEIVLGVDADPGEAVSTRVAEGSTSQVAVSAELPAGASAERNVTVSVAVGAEGDGAVASEDGSGADYAKVDDFAITIPAGAGRGAGSFTLAATDDDTAGEGEESVTVRGTAAGFTVASALVSILDGDEAGAGKGPDKEKTPGLDVPAEVVEYQMPAPDKVVLSADVSEAEEGAASAPTVTVTASFPDGTATLTSAVTVTVSVGKSGDTATGSADGSGADYANVESFNLEIPAGSSSVAHATGFTLTVTDDMLAEGDETLTITGSTAAAGITAVEEATITITDDADSTITLTVDTDLGQSTFNEVEEVGNVPGGPYQIALAVDADLPTGITAARHLPVYFGLGAAGDGAVGSETGAGADYRNIGLYSFSNTIVAGRSGFAGYNLVFQSTNDDLAGEGRESVSVTGRVLMLPSLAEIAGFTVASGEFYITDTDEIPDIVYNVSPTRVSEAASSPQITVTATYEVSTLQVVADVTVSITTGKMGDSATWSANGAGADYATPTIPDITLAAGVKTGQTQFNLALTNDSDVEGDEILTLNIAAQAPGRGFSEADGVITIVDDDGLITLTLSSTSLGEESGTTGVVVTASMPSGSTAPATGITVSVTAGKSGDSATGSADGTGADYANLTIPAITIASGSSTASAASQNLTITSDDLAEGDETITFTGTVTTPSSSSYRVSEAQLTITDDDDVITLSVNPNSVAENAGSVPITVTAALPSGKTAADNFALTVSVGKDGDTATGSRTGSGADYVNVYDRELDISGGASQGTVNFILTVTDDPDWEGNETSSLTLVGTLSTFTINEPVITITGDNDLNPAACGDGTYVDDASTQTGLASDCRALVNIRNHWVSTSANYDWPADHPVLTWGASSTAKIQNWEGVTRTDTDSGTPEVWRVTRLEMLDETVARLDPDDPDTAITENFQRPGWSVYGILPPSIGDLTALEYLHLNNNRLLGSIPTEIGDLTNLSELYLHGNLFFSVLPDELGSLTNLTELLMTDNLLRGGIPSALGSLTNLTKLWLDDNLLSGTLPTQLGSLTNLEELHLQKNLLSGPIPTQLANLTNLKELILSDNYSTSYSQTLQRFIYASGFTGSIPKELSWLSNLEKLYLDDNALTGAIPAELGNLNQLDELWLEDNRLSGSIPAELGNLSSLTGLDLSKNLLNSIPAELGDLSNLEYLTLDRNRIASLPAGLGRLSNLESLILSDNLLTGTIPAELGNLAPSEGGSLRVLYIHNPGPLGPLPEPLLGIRWIDLFAYDDPLDLIAFYEFSRRLGTSRTYEVWTCDVGGPYDITPQAATSLLNAQFTDFFRQMSGGKFTLAFTVGGAVAASPLPAAGAARTTTQLAAPRKSCRDQIRPDRDSQDNNRDTDRRIIIIDNARINDGFNHHYYLLGIGSAVPLDSPGYQKLTTDSIIQVGGATVTGLRPRLSTVAHEIGHDIQWPHSYGGRFVRITASGREVWEYDNLMDLMSGRRTYNLTTGTIASNYYASGWIEPEEVAVHTGAGASYDLSPTGEGGTRMLVLPTSWGPGVFYTLGVRTQQGFDREVPEEGVELYFIDQRRNSCRAPFAGVCGNIRRRVQPVNPPDRDADSQLPYTIENVFDIGDDFTLNVGLGIGESNRLPVEITGREGNKFTVRVADLPFTPVSSRSILGLPEQINLSVNVADGATVPESTSRRITVTAAYPPSSRASRYDAEVKMSVAGSATAGSDFTAPNNFSVTIPEGESQASRTFMLQATNDNRQEEQETITLSFQAPGYELTGRRSVTLTIPRNGQPDPRPTPQPTPTPSGGGGSGGGGGGGSSPPPVVPPVTPPPPAEPPEPACQGRFCDDDGSVHQANIEQIAQWEITLGCDAQDATQFCPSAQITRRQMAAFLYRAVSQRWTIEAPEGIEISDVPADAWYRTYADWVVSTGAFAASDGIFNPGGIVTRADMAVMMVAAFPHLESVAEARELFEDLGGVDEDTLRAVEGLFGSGVTKGCATSPLRYCPDKPVTRAQMASFFVRAINLAPAPASP